MINCQRFVGFTAIIVWAAFASDSLQAQDLPGGSVGIGPQPGSGWQTGTVQPMAISPAGSPVGGTHQHGQLSGWNTHQEYRGSPTWYNGTGFAPTGWQFGFPMAFTDNGPRFPPVNTWAGDPGGRVFQSWPGTVNAVERFDRRQGVIDAQAFSNFLLLQPRSQFQFLPVQRYWGTGFGGPGIDWPWVTQSPVAAPGGSVDSGTTSAASQVGGGGPAVSPIVFGYLANSRLTARRVAKGEKQGSSPETGTPSAATGLLLAQADSPAPGTAKTEPAAVDPLAAASAKAFTANGEREFKRGNYKGAVYAWKHAAVDDPGNGVLLLMLGQAFFATGDYTSAAGATQRGMVQLPKEEWGVVITHYRELYGRAQDYTDQLRALEKGVKNKPNDPALRFLAGFHYAGLGFPQVAIDQLDKGLKVAPRDEVAQHLRRELQSQLEKAATAGVEKAAPAEQRPVAEGNK